MEGRALVWFDWDCSSNVVDCWMVQFVGIFESSLCEPPHASVRRPLANRIHGGRMGRPVGSASLLVESW
jgi:hypothetical protein